MNNSSEKPKLEREERIKLKTDEGQAPETFEAREDDLDKIAEEVVPQVEADKTEVLASADKIIDSAPASVGLSPEKAQEIYTTGGFAKRIKDIKEKISVLAENVKERTSLALLKFKGIENPERVLALAHYLEDTAVEVELKDLEFEKTEVEEIKKAVEELEQLGYDVRIDELRYGYDTANTKTYIYARKENRYLFSARPSKFLAKDLDEMVKSPNDPRLMFEALRDNGCELKIWKGGTFLLGSEMKKLFQKPNALSFLEKIKTFGGKNITHEYFKDYRSLDKISNLAEIDSTKNLFSPENEKGVEKISALLGCPISSKNLESWIHISQNDNLVEIFSLLKQKNERQNLDERDWISKLEIIKNAGIENEILPLLREGFTENSLRNIFRGWGNEQAIKDLHSATEAFKDNPQLYQLVRGASVISNMVDSLGQNKMQKFQQLEEKVPEAGPAFASLVEMNILGDRWQFDEYLDDPEKVAKYKEMLETVVEPNFKTFASACEKAGHQFTLEDFFNDRPEYNRLMECYKDESFRSAISSESGVELIKYLGILNVPTERWNMWAVKTFLEIPDSMAMLTKLEENYDYKHDPNFGGRYYELSRLLNKLKNPEFCNKFFEPKTIETVKLIDSEFGLKFSLDYAEKLIENSEDEKFQDALQDPETISFIKNGLKNGSENIEIITALAKCDQTLRPYILS